MFQPVNDDLYHELAAAAVLPRPTLKRGHKDPTARTMAFGAGREMQPLSAALARYAAAEGFERPDVVLWCGDEVGRRMTREDVRDAERDGWAVSGYRSELRSATFSKGGYTVQVRSSAVWFGTERDTLRIREAWYELGRWLRAGFGDWAYLWPTPTMTGQELLRGKLPFNREYPPIPVRELELLLSTTTGGRTEILTAPGGFNAGLGFVGELYNLDMRWSYASCLHGLPVGRTVHETTLRPEPLTLAMVGYQPSFYKFRARVPRDWKHIGILPCREQGETTYPFEPGREFYGWATGAEIQVALIHGWAVWASDLIHWPETARHDVMGEWIKQVRALRERAERAVLAGDRLAPLVVAALRNLVVHTVGSWNRVSRIDEGYVPYGQESAIPAGGVPLPDAAGRGWQWKRNILQLDEWSHPEWYGTVAGRVRAKLAKMALQLPPQDIVRLATDGMLITDRPPEALVTDLGTPGSWRVKWHLPFAMTAPRSLGEVLRILELARTSGAVAGMAALVADTDHLEDE